MSRIIQRIKNIKMETSLDFLFEKYLKPYIWEGDIWIDGGWGPKDKILELCVGDPINGFELPFYLTPVNEIDDNGKSTMERYNLTFPGEQHLILQHFIEAVKESGAEEQRYILYSYFLNKPPDAGESIYQLNIIATQEKTTFTIEKGNWIPSFDSSLLSARWST